MRAHSLFAAMAVASVFAACSGTTEPGAVQGTSGSAGGGGAPGAGGAGTGGGLDAGACPASRPSGACVNEGQACDYSLCGKSAPCRCKGGTWECELVDCADVGPPPQGPCPSSPPTGACAQQDLQCWYGDDPRPWCRTQATCVQGEWMVAAPKCVGQSPDCPTDPSDPPDGLCGGSAPTFCDYGEGLVCECVWYEGPPTDGGTPMQWECWDAPGPGCPKIAPNAGQPCDLPGSAQCVYGPTCNSMYMKCEDGYWVSAGQAVC